VLDAGDGDWSPVWALVQPQVAKWTRACSYDRAGYGWSGPAPRPRTVERLADELHSALHTAGIRGPYILVGHAFGNFPVRAFADKYLEDVAGIVLLDPGAPDVDPSGAYSELLKDIQATELAYTHMCRDAIVAGKKLPLTPPADHPTWTCFTYSF